MKENLQLTILQKEETGFFRGGPLMIWGGRAKVGKKTQRLLARETVGWPGKKTQREFSARGPPQIINGKPLSANLRN